MERESMHWLEGSACSVIPGTVGSQGRARMGLGWVGTAQDLEAAMPNVAALWQGPCGGVPCNYTQGLRRWHFPVAFTFRIFA